jgi:hypothetical protein
MYGLRSSSIAQLPDGRTLHREGFTSPGVVLAGNYVSHTESLRQRQVTDAACVATLRCGESPFNRVMTCTTPANTYYRQNRNHKGDYAFRIPGVCSCAIYCSAGTYLPDLYTSRAKSRSRSVKSASCAAAEGAQGRESAGLKPIKCEP